MHGRRGCPAGDPVAGDNADMNILVVTNLYPPQELGGYGRSIADFVWGLRERGNTIQVLTTDAPYLGANSNLGPNGEEVDRRLKLKGSYNGGVQPLQDLQQRQTIDNDNATHPSLSPTSEVGWNPLAISTCSALNSLHLEAPCIVQHHVGFVHAPFPPSAWPKNDRYKMVGASEAVRSALVSAGLPARNGESCLPGCSKRTLRGTPG